MKAIIKIAAALGLGLLGLAILETIEENPQLVKKVLEVLRKEPKLCRERK